MNSDDRRDELAEDLALCRSELALSRRQQETLAEELAVAEQRQRDLRGCAYALARSADRHLASTTPPPSLFGRISRTLGRGGQEADHETELVTLLRASDLFDGAWYLLKHPAVVTTSLDPARHYLRHGARKAWDPSAEFDSHEFLNQNPDVAASGENPLIAHLRRTKARGSA